MDFRPKMIICGGSAYPREWDYKRIRAIADKAGGGGGGGGSDVELVGSPGDVRHGAPRPHSPTPTPTLIPFMALTSRWAR